RGVFTSRGKQAHLSEILECQHVRSQDWVILNDADEFVDWEPVMKRYGRPNLPSLLAFLADSGYTHVRGVLVDRVSESGRVDIEQDDEPWGTDVRELSRKYPLLCNITAEIVQGGTSKVVAFLGNYRLTPGHHNPEGVWGCDGKLNRKKVPSR